MFYPKLLNESTSVLTTPMFSNVAVGSYCKRTLFGAFFSKSSPLVASKAWIMLPVIGSEQEMKIGKQTNC